MGYLVIGLFVLFGIYACRNVTTWYFDIEGNQI